MTSCPASQPACPQSALQPAACPSASGTGPLKPVSRLSSFMRLFAPWKWRRKKKSNRFAQTSRSLERRISLRASKDDLIQRGVLLPDLKSDFTPKHQELDVCALPADDSKRDNGQSASAATSAGVGLSRVSPAASHLTGAVATCLVGMNPMLRSSLNGRLPATDSDLSDSLSHQKQGTQKSTSVHQSHQLATAAALQSRGMYPCHWLFLKSHVFNRTSSSVGHFSGVAIELFGS